MDNPSSLTFFLFCFCWVALIAGAVLGYIIGIRMARNRERHRLVKEKIRKNKVAIYHYQKEKYDYIEQINRLEQDLQNLTEESELYKERVSDLEYYKRKVREHEQVIERLSSASSETIELPVNAFCCNSNKIRYALISAGRNGWNCFVRPTFFSITS